MTQPSIDALTLAVIQAGLQQVCNEMDVAFSRSAFSPQEASSCIAFEGLWRIHKGHTQ